MSVGNTTTSSILLQTSLEPWDLLPPPTPTAAAAGIPMDFQRSPIVRNAVRVMARVIVYAHVIAPGRWRDVLHGNDGRYTGDGRRFIANNRFWSIDVCTAEAIKPIGRRLMRALKTITRIDDGKRGKRYFCSFEMNNNIKIKKTKTTSTTPRIQGGWTRSVYVSVGITGVSKSPDVRVSDGIRKWKQYDFKNINGSLTLFFTTFLCIVRA